MNTTVRTHVISSGRLMDLS